MVTSRFRNKIALPLVGAIIGLGSVGAWAFSQNGMGANSGAFVQGVSRAYDGDGVYVHNVKIRLWGIDAPELGTPDGDVSYAALSAYLGRGWVKCKPPPGERDFPISGNRKVALCTFRGVDLARWLVENGYARDWLKFSNGYYASVESRRKLQ